MNKVLLASHGTDGAQAAERKAMEFCAQGAQLHHLIVVPTLWQGMTGDDWLNNGVSRDRFRRYLEGELGREIDEHRERVSRIAAEHALDYSSEIVVGEPDDCLVEASRKTDYDLIVMGSPRPKGKKGLRSRMTTVDLTRAVAAPLLIVPYPNV